MVELKVANELRGDLPSVEFQLLVPFLGKMRTEIWRTWRVCWPSVSSILVWSWQSCLALHRVHIGVCVLLSAMKYCARRAEVQDVLSHMTPQRCRLYLQLWSLLCCRREGWERGMVSCFSGATLDLAAMRLTIYLLFSPFCRDFISTDIHSMSPFSQADFPSRSRCLDHTFLSSAHIFCSIIDNMWQLSIS